MSSQNSSNDNEKYSKKLADMTSKVKNLLGTVDENFMVDMHQYIEPRKNIQEITDFYDLILESKKSHFLVLKKLERNNFIGKDKKIFKMEIKEIEKINILEDFNNINQNEIKLKKYSEVSMVTQMIQDLNNLKEIILEIIENSILEELKRIPKIVENADKYTKFILTRPNSQSFVKKYVNIVLERMGFSGIKNNHDIIIQRTKNLTKHFNLVIKFNKVMLGSKNAKIINEGIIKHMILELNEIFLGVLEKIKVDNKAEKIPFLINLYSNIKHGDEDFVSEIEDLFIFKSDILTLIFNCFVQFFADLDSINHSNSKFENEKICILLFKILNEFENHKEVKRAWVEKYGASFGVYNYENLNDNFVDKLFIQIFDLAEKMEIEQKSFYILNNISQFKTLANSINERKISEIIYKNCEIIVGLWTIELNTKNLNEIYSKVLNLIKKAKKFILPEEERIFVVTKIKKNFEYLSSDIESTDKIKEINKSLDNLYK